MISYNHVYLKGKTTMELFYMLISITILIFSSILHEIAHGFIAYRLGDPTAKILGRLTLNPKPHIDPFMTILLPVMTFLGSGGRLIFGGAKPVPVDPFNLRDGMKDLALVSLAGPGTNILLAICGAFLAHIIFPGATINEIALSGIFGFIVKTIIEWNILLAALNLLPIPPLDGSKLFALLLPKHIANAYLAFGQNSIGLMILLILFYFPIGGFSLANFLGIIIVFSLKLLGLT